MGASGTSYPATRLEFDSFTQLRAIFAANSVPAGTYSVRVSQPDGDQVVLANAFRFVAGGAAHLEAHLDVVGLLAVAR